MNDSLTRWLIKYRQRYGPFAIGFLLGVALYTGGQGYAWDAVFYLGFALLAAVLVYGPLDETEAEHSKH